MKIKKTFHYNCLKLYLKKSKYIYYWTSNVSFIINIKKNIKLILFNKKSSK